MSVSRKIFLANVMLPAATATSLVTLMQASALHWTLEADLTTPSLDSILGSEVGIVPSATIYAGSDANVRGGALGGGTYKGVTVLANANFSLQDFGPIGSLDPNQIWLYNQSGCSLDLIFTAR